MSDPQLTATMTLYRPGVEPNFNEFTWVPPQEILDYIKATYTDTGLMTEEVVWDIDPQYPQRSIKTHIQSFRDQAAKDQFFADEKLKANAEARKAFHANLGIAEQNNHDQGN